MNDTERETKASRSKRLEGIKKLGGAASNLPCGQGLIKRILPLPRVEAFDVVEDPKDDWVFGSLDKVGEALGFERAREAFHSGVVVAVARGTACVLPRHSL
jgi:hypothetical protein